MVRLLFSWLERDVIGVHAAAYLLGFSALLSQVLGLLRDRLLASTFGASTSLDIYYAAFRVQDFVFLSIASLVSLSVLIPFLSEREAKGEREMKGFLDSVFSVFFALIALASAAAYLAMPVLVPVLFPGFAGTEHEEAVLGLSRILLLSPVLLGVSNLLASVLQLRRKYFIYALSPLLYNLGIITGILLFYPRFGLSGLGYGVLLGGLLHLSIQLPAIASMRLLPRLRIPESFETIWRVMALSLPRTLALSANHLALMGLTAAATLMNAGSIAILAFSLNLQSVAVSIIGASYSVAAFPVLAASVSHGDRSEFLKHLYAAARHIIFWSFPAAVLFIVLRAHIVRVVLGSGSFDWNDTRLTAACLALLALAIVPQNLTLLFMRAYYALGNTRIPLLAGLLSAVSTVAAAGAIAPLFARLPELRYFIESLLRVEDLSGTIVLTLPLALLAGSLVGFLTLLAFAPKDFPGLSRALGMTALHSFSAAIVMGFVSYRLLSELGDFFGLETLLALTLQGAVSALVGVAAGVLLLLLFRNPEAEEIGKSIRRRFWKDGVVASPEQMY
ncbi:MAG TPA: lipid II flippase MurJ [Candidatus Paceibacterota bacterium]|nr:lipid II flippase MurJ [Candidatus Paceibacterota bacterium]